MSESTRFLLGGIRLGLGSTLGGQRVYTGEIVVEAEVVEDGRVWTVRPVLTLAERRALHALAEQIGARVLAEHARALVDEDDGAADDAANGRWPVG